MVHCSAIAASAFLMIFEQRALHFHFSVGSAHFVPGPVWSYDEKLLRSLRIRKSEVGVSLELSSMPLTLKIFAGVKTILLTYPANVYEQKK